MGSRGPLSGGASPGAEDGFFPFVLDGGVPGPGEPEDLALQLQQKEQDLLLAAELGKMLLERNEELRRQLETLGAQHAEREERLQQENHELRRGLAARGAEWEARAVELEGDVEALRAQLGEQRSEQQDSGRERARALGELSEQNLRLTQQLAQASQTEQELQRELDGFRGQWQAQALAEAELRTRLESLRAENQMLQSRRQDLEAQIRGLRAEVDKGQGRLQTTHEELLLLRRESKESSLELERARSEAAEARGALRRLQRRVSELEEESRLRDAGATGASLQAELAHSLGGDPGPDASAAGDGQPPDLAPRGQLGAPQEASALEPRGKSGGEGGRSGPAAGRGGAAERGAAEPAGGAAAAEGAPRAGRPRAGRARRAGRPGRGGEQGPGAVAGAEPRLAGARLAVPGADARHPPEGGADAGARGLAGRHAGGDRAAAALPAPEGAERGDATPSPDPLLPAPGPGAGRWLPQ